MTITTVQTINISKENEPFVQLIIKKAGGFISEKETVEEALNRILAMPIHFLTRSMVVPTLYEYFGIVGKENSDNLVSLIDDGALTTVTTITE
jgi:hypothetical protein